MKEKHIVKKQNGIGSFNDVCLSLSTRPLYFFLSLFLFLSLSQLMAADGGVGGGWEQWVGVGRRGREEC